MGSPDEAGGSWAVESEAKEDAYKFVICVALGFAGVGVLLACLSIPAFLSYTHHMRAFSDVDLDYCRSANLDLSLNFASARASWAKSRTNSTRTKRYEPPHQLPRNAFAHDDTILLATGFGFQDCPACCMPGVRGPGGDAGLPGMHGAPGPHGAPGRPGITPNASCIPERIFEPPPCLPCPQGPRGQPGHPGFPGEEGDSGLKGQPGKRGFSGNRGLPGVQGPPGSRGAPGPLGDPGFTPEAKVISGPPGDPGDPGPWGLPGHPGLTGQSGFAGTPGERGWPGSPGDPGLLGPRGPEGPLGEAGPPGTPGTCVCQETEVVVEDFAQQAYDLNKQRGGGGLATHPSQPPAPPIRPIIPDYPDEYGGGNLFPEDTFLPVLDEDNMIYYDVPQEFRVPQGEAASVFGPQPIGPFSNQPRTANIRQAPASTAQEQDPKAFYAPPAKWGSSVPSEVKVLPQSTNAVPSSPAQPQIKASHSWGRGGK